MRWDFLFLWFESLASLFRRRKKDEDSLDVCLNCQTPLSNKDYFCPNCGQKKRVSKITIWTLIGEFLENVFNLDSSAWRSIRNIVRPAFLAREFIAGRRKKYFNPVRFFLLALILHFAIISFVIDIDKLDSFSIKAYTELGKSELKQSFNNWVDSTVQDSILIDFTDTIESRFFEKIKTPDKDTLFQLPDIAFTDMSKYRFLRSDVYQLDVDSLLSKYEVLPFWERLVVSQNIRAIRNLKGAFQFFIGNMIWGIISTIFIIALFMKILYIRRNRFYVEHIVLLFDIHTFGFLLFSIVFIVLNLNNTTHTAIASSTGGFLLILYFFLSLKWYYRQGFIKTLIKFLMISVSYFITILVMVSLVFVTSLLLFK